MRSTLQRLSGNELPDHPALAYEAWAPVQALDGKINERERQGWLERVASTPVPKDYSRAYDNWKCSFKSPGDQLFELTLCSRLLVGHGNPSATDVGITLHHTWGVPIIPGSAIKGLLAHFIDTVHGPEDPGLPPWQQQGDEQSRAGFKGLTWIGNKVKYGPGEVYRVLFGAPDAIEDDECRKHGEAAGAYMGRVVFHDALFVPGQTEPPLAVDVLTVHQKGYYNSAGQSWPNDYDSPNPVSFLSVRPGVRMLFALSGREDWTLLARGLLEQALEQWGIGSKTSSGYGRLAATPVSAGRMPATGEKVTCILLQERTRKGGWRARYPGSGQVGPVQNSGDVPADAKPGESSTLIVASVNETSIAFRYPVQVVAPQEQKQKPGKKKR